MIKSLYTTNHESLTDKIDTADKKAATQTNAKPDRHIIWSNVHFDFADWGDDLRAEYPNETENDLYELMQEVNGEYLEDGRINLIFS